MSTQTTSVPTDARSHEIELWHMCAQHPREVDPPCGPMCVAFCGHKFASEVDECVSYTLTPDVCVVCASMSSLWAGRS